GLEVIPVIEAAKRSSVQRKSQTLNWTSDFPEGPIGAIIQARMGSHRLPGKSLAEIENRPMLWHVIQRVKRATLVDRVGGVTSTNTDDDVIADMCAQNG